LASRTKEVHTCPQRSLANNQITLLPKKPQSPPLSRQSINESRNTILHLSLHLNHKFLKSNNNLCSPLQTHLMLLKTSLHMFRHKALQEDDHALKLLIKQVASPLSQINLLSNSSRSNQHPKSSNSQLPPLTPSPSSTTMTPPRNSKSKKVNQWEATWMIFSTSRAVQLQATMQLRKGLS